MGDRLSGLSEEEKREIIKFGIERGKILLFSSAGIVLLGYLFNVPKESVAFLFSLYFLRIYAGGYHAKTQTRCLVLSAMIVCIGFGSIKYLSGWSKDILFFGALMAGSIVWKLAPVENQNKLLDDVEKKEYAKKARIVLLCQVSVLVWTYYFDCTEVFMGVVLAVVITAVGVVGGKIQNKKMSKKGHIVLAATVILLSAYMRLGVDAKEADSDISPQDIIILLDASQSMKEADEQYASVDFVKGLAASLPSHYRLGMIVYQEEVIKRIPLGSSYSAIEDELTDLTYRQYGDAGAALMEACTVFSEEENQKRIVWITDGELLLSTTERTQESAACYQQAIEEVQRQGIVVDVLSLGEKKTNGETVYSAAELSGGTLQELGSGELLGQHLETYLFSVLGIKAKQVGSLTGSSGEITLTLPDTSMEQTKILLLGKGLGENLTISAEAEQLELHKGSYFAVMDLLRPDNPEVTLQMKGEVGKEMDLNAYLFSEYAYSLEANHFLQPDRGITTLELSLLNPRGETLFTQDSIGSIEVFLAGKEQPYQVKDGVAQWEQTYEESEEVTIEVNFPASRSYYYGDNTVSEEILIPKQKEEQTDWLFWGILMLFLFANGGILYLAVKKRRRQVRKPGGIADKGLPLVEKENGKTTFYGKLVVYVIQTKEEIDYPPASINLFGRCNRSVITLEWILDTCSLPLSLKGADQITFKPGKEKNLVVQNKGKTSVLKGKELLLKGKAYPMYYHEKITFLFEEEGTEIEVHYKDLKPSER